VPESLLKLSEHKNAAIYKSWVDKGYLIATPGEVVDYDYVKRDIFELAQMYNLLSVSYDPWGSTYLMTQLLAEDITIEKTRPGYQTMSPACKELEIFASTGRITHDNNPVMNWALGNVVMEMDAAGNIKPTKIKSPNKIDPAMGLINAFHVYMLEVQEKNLFSERGIISL
jgi:phage terminase large subunit-like protein